MTLRMNKQKSVESGYISRILYSPAVWPEEKEFQVVVTYIGCIYGQPLNIYYDYLLFEFIIFTFYLILHNFFGVRKLP